MVAPQRRDKTPRSISGLRTGFDGGCVDLIMEGDLEPLVSVAFRGNEFRFRIGDWRMINEAVENMMNGGGDE